MREILNKYVNLDIIDIITSFIPDNLYHECIICNEFPCVLDTHIRYEYELNYFKRKIYYCENCLNI